MAKLGTYTGLRNLQKINQARSDRLEELQSAAAQRAAERADDRKYSEDEFNRRLKANEQSDLKKTVLKNVLGSGTFEDAFGATRTTKKDSKTTPEAAIAGLNKYGVDANLLANFKVSAETIGDSSAIVSAFNKMKSFRSTLVKELGGVEGDEVFNSYFLPQANALLENAIFEPSAQTDPSILVAKVENIIGEKLDDIYKNAILSRKTSGSTVFPTEMEFSKPISVADLGNWKDVITSDVVDRGNNEILLINKLTNAVTTNLQESTMADAKGNIVALSPDTEQLFKEVNAWLNARGQKVLNALENTTGKNKSYANIVSLYGNSFVNKYGNYPKLRDAALPDFLTTESAKQPVSVPNRSILDALRTAGIILPGDVVIIGNGNPQVVPE